MGDFSSFFLTFCTYVCLLLVCWLVFVLFCSINLLYFIFLSNRPIIPNVTHYSRFT